MDIERILEDFVPVRRYPGYLISRDGMIIDAVMHGPLQVHRNNYNTPYVRIQNERDIWCSVPVHALVADEFCHQPPPILGMVSSAIIFKDFDKQNYHADNLEIRWTRYAIQYNLLPKRPSPVNPFHPGSALDYQEMALYEATTNVAADEGLRYFAQQYGLLPYGLKKAVAKWSTINTSYYGNQDLVDYTVKLIDWLGLEFEIM